MDKKALITIGKLSKFSRVPRTTLIHYDKVGVLKPVFVDKNNYRYYAFDQIGWVNLIRTMQFLGM
jgi:DNA-binding transcriptional MerR regulator